jgi:hypothetical protein
MEIDNQNTSTNKPFITSNYLLVEILSYIDILHRIVPKFLRVNKFFMQFITNNINKLF